MVKDTKDIFSQKSPQVRKCYACGVNTTWWLDIQVDMQPPVYNTICVIAMVLTLSNIVCNTYITPILRLIT